MSKEIAKGQFPSMNKDDVAMRKGFFMKKNVIKILLDIIMFVVLFTMYSKNAINMSYHEIGGLALCGLLIIHNGLNWKWIMIVTKKFFGKSLPIRTRIGYILNLLLFISITGIAVSGIMISKTIFTSIHGTWFGWKSLHYFLASLTVVLMGVHLGLHWTFIKQMFSRMIKLPGIVVKPVVVLLCTAIIVYGGYNLTSTSFLRWLSTPITLSTMTSSGTAFGVEHGGVEDGALTDGSKEGTTMDRSENNQKLMPKGDHMRGERPEGTMPGESTGTSSTWINFFSTLASYGSIASLFAAITVVISKLFRRRKPSEPIESDPTNTDNPIIEV